MIMNSKQFIPEVYSRERDMQVFTTLIDLIMTASKYDIDTLYRIYDASQCPSQLLPELANTVNYIYDNANTEISNRKIIQLFMLMLRNKGSITGLKMATALCLTTLDLSIKSLETEDVNVDYISALSDLEVKIDYENATITIDYPNIYTQVRYLLDYVRPVGMVIILRSIIKSNSTVAGGVLAQVVSDVIPYTIKKSTINTSVVNFSSPITQEFLDEWEQQFPNTINLNEGENNG